jgi:hypothetical protein
MIATRTADRKISPWRRESPKVPIPAPRETPHTAL